LPIHYFHVVFTMPGSIALLALQNKQVLYDILFQAGGGALLEIGADPDHLGAELGYIAVLHTWGQNLMLHPHIHCIVPGGGISLDGTRWVATRKTFLLSVRVLSKRFRTLFTEALEKAFDQGLLEFHGNLEHLAKPAVFRSWLKSTRSSDWVVYAKPPFGSPEQTLQYIGRYTHRVAISNQRLKSVTDNQVTFEWKDNRRKKAHLLMTLHVHEFMRRFLLHVLPPGFVRIRHGGFLANRHRTARLALCRELLEKANQPDTHHPAPTVPGPSAPEARAATSRRHCPKCNTATLRTVSVIPSDLPPSPRARLRRRRQRLLRLASTWKDPTLAVAAA
jgi:hypothetical protein